MGAFVERRWTRHPHGCVRVKRLFDILVLRLRSLFGRPRVDQELDRELAFHLDQQVKENIESGMSPDDARAAARRSLGGVSQIQEECRDMRRTNQIETIWNDLRYAIRTLARTPGFTTIIVLTLALSIGANSAIFSVIQGVLLKPLPYPHPDRLARIYFQSDTQPKFPLNPNDFRDFRERNRTFESMAAMTRQDLQLSGIGGEPMMLRGFGVTAGYFQMLGVSPARGRDFSTEDELPERGRLAILSDHLWRSRFASESWPETPSTFGHPTAFIKCPRIAARTSWTPSDGSSPVFPPSRVRPIYPAYSNSSRRSIQARVGGCIRSLSIRKSLDARNACCSCSSLL